MTRATRSVREPRTSQPRHRLRIEHLAETGGRPFHEPFTVAGLCEVYEAVWDTAIDPRDFHRKVTGAEGFLEDTGRRTTRGGGRPAMLYVAGPASQLHPPVLRPEPVRSTPSARR